MRGRKPKSTAQRRLEGNAGKRGFNRNEPQPPPLADPAADQVNGDEAPDVDLAPPAELVNIPDALAEWNRLAPMLKRIRQITEADRAALLAVCIEWARYLEAKAKAFPRVVSSPKGYPMPNPWLSIQTKALQACMKLWPELGLTPSSRSRVKTDAVPIDGDAFSEFDDGHLDDDDDDTNGEPPTTH